MKEFAQSDEFKEACQKALNEIENGNNPKYKSEIVETEKEIIKLSNRGYDCQKIDDGRWLMRKEININSSV